MTVNDDATGSRTATICDSCGSPGATRHVRGGFNFHEPRCPSAAERSGEAMSAVERILLRRGRELQRGEAYEIVEAVRTYLEARREHEVDP